MAPKSEHVGEASNIASPPSQGEILAVIADVTRVQQSVQEAHRNMKIHVGGKRFFVHLGALDNGFSRCFNGLHFASASHAFGSLLHRCGNKAQVFFECCQKQRKVQAEDVSFSHCLCRIAIYGIYRFLYQDYTYIYIYIIWLYLYWVTLGNIVFW